MLKKALLVSIVLINTIGLSFAQTQQTKQRVNTDTKQQVISEDNTAKMVVVEVKTSEDAELPADAPMYQDTGNPEQDKKAYEDAKKAWIEAHPEQYKAIIDRSKKGTNNTQIQK
ncbi:MAG: hypothetical protein JXR60_06145 [Bacteroidales bacterium]|nr:hypothetical protein [Bacteroidales bacterium]